MAIMESAHDFTDEATEAAIGDKSNKMLTLVVQPKSMKQENRADTKEQNFRDTQPLQSMEQTKDNFAKNCNSLDQKDTEK